MVLATPAFRSYGLGPRLPVAAAGHGALDFTLGAKADSETILHGLQPTVQRPPYTKTAALPR
ncbi:hypothetical protein QTO34_016336 [Cnephaeus nilssonii]|uniref:Uncharacterized protein n=1 Tax=Cnephaeus nilssonii TaxID=3371016 RepID=A0AA40I5Z8_CNENI|nr:hypothetical protein QTO34_016336 [Eptesicus nilssonii]